MICIFAPSLLILIQCLYNDTVVRWEFTPINMKNVPQRHAAANRNLAATYCCYRLLPTSPFNITQIGTSVRYAINHWKKEYAWDIHFGYKMIHSSRETEKAVDFSTCVTPHVLPTQYDRRELITRIWPYFYLHYLTRWPRDRQRRDDGRIHVGTQCISGR